MLVLNLAQIPRISLRRTSVTSMETATTEAASTPRFRLLVVDDERDVLDLMTDVLEMAGWEVTSCTSPLAAFERVKRNRFDALVLDVYMPELPGMLLHAKVKVLDRELAQRTVFVSGHFSRDELKKDLEKNAILLQKPFQPQDLVATIERVLPSSPRV